MASSLSYQRDNSSLYRYHARYNPMVLACRPCPLANLSYCFERFREPTATRSLHVSIKLIKNAVEKLRNATGARQRSAETFTSGDPTPIVGVLPMRSQVLSDPGSSTVTTEREFRARLPRRARYTLGLGEPLQQLNSRAYARAAGESSK